jgi:endonuclease/exonuclease/phosphatase family metal-dependent hydrolase
MTVRDHPIVLGTSSLAGAALGAYAVRWAGRGTLATIAGGVVSATIATIAVSELSTRLRDSAHKAPRSLEGLPAASVTPRGTERVKVMTYNVHGGMGKDSMGSSTDKLDLLAERILNERPDIVILQELDLAALRSNGRDTFDELVKRLKPTSAVAASPGVLMTGQSQHNGVLTFNGFHIDNARNLIFEDPVGDGPVRRIGGAITDAKKALFRHILHKKIPMTWDYPSYAPRNAVDTVVRTPLGNDIRVVGLHFNGNAREVNYQDEQIAPLASRLDVWRGPTLLAGDFNVWSRTRQGMTERHLLSMAGLRDNFLRLGVPFEDQRRDSTPLQSQKLSDIDRIYSSSHFAVHDVHVDNEAPFASDHSPVISTMVLNPPDEPEEPTVVEKPADELEPDPDPNLDPERDEPTNDPPAEEPTTPGDGGPAGEPKEPVEPASPGRR